MHLDILVKIAKCTAGISQANISSTFHSRQPQMVNLFFLQACGSTNYHLFYLGVNTFVLKPCVPGMVFNGCAMAMPYVLVEMISLCHTHFTLAMNSLTVKSFPEPRCRFITFTYGTSRLISRALGKHFPLIWVMAMN